MLERDKEEGRERQKGEREGQREKQREREREERIGEVKAVPGSFLCRVCDVDFQLVFWGVRLLNSDWWL